MRVPVSRAAPLICGVPVEAVTVKSVEPITEAKAAEIVEVPPALAEARPVPLIVAEDVLEEVHVASRERLRMPSEYRPVAVNCRVATRRSVGWPA